MPQSNPDSTIPLTANTQEPGSTLTLASGVWEHFTARLPKPTHDFTGRTVLVTGGNAGLGYETVLHLARNNASRIIIASRNRSKCEQQVQQVYKSVPSFKGEIDIETVDLMDFKSVIAFGERITNDPRRLDVVVANAGLMTMNFKKTGDGYEQVLQVNALSTGLLALLLLPKLEETARMEEPKGSSPLKPHLCIVSSEMHYLAKFPQHASPEPLLETLNSPAKEHYVDGSERYNISKLLDVFLVREIAKLPAVTSGAVIVNSVNPGLCKSGFRDDLGVVLSTIMNWIAWTCEFGSRNYLHAISHDTTPGAYISACTERPVSYFTVSSEGQRAQKRFWNECVDLWKSLTEDVSKAGV